MVQLLPEAIRQVSEVNHPPPAGDAPLPSGIPQARLTTVGNDYWGDNTPSLTVHSKRPAPPDSHLLAPACIPAAPPPDL